MTLPTAVEPLYVVDTHALIWYLKGDSKLSATAASIFEAAKRGETQLVFSAIVAAEMYYADKKHHLFADFAQTFQTLKRQPYIQFVDFAADDVLNFDRDSAVPEMHDRMIIGLARRIGAPLVTHDPQITASKLVPIVR